MKAVSTRQPPLVCIIDDDASVLKAFARLLRAAGFEPRTYQSPDAFLGEFESGSPACLILDVLMPEWTDVQAHEKLKACAANVPIIAVSGWEGVEARVHANALGAKYFLRKPVDDEVLLATIAAAMQSS